MLIFHNQPNIQHMFLVQICDIHLLQLLQTDNIIFCYNFDYKFDIYDAFIFLMPSNHMFRLKVPDY